MQKFIFSVLIVIGTLFILPVNAQIFNPINWKSESILWSTYTRNHDLETSALHPRMRFEYNNLPVFQDKYLYQVANNFDFAYSGYFVQKIDLLTGQEIWHTHRFSDMTMNPKPLREYAVSPYIKDGRIGFYIFREYRPNNVFTSIWGRSTIGQAEYDIAKGDSLKYKLTSLDDPLNRQLFNGLPGLGRHTFVNGVDGLSEYVMMSRKCPMECKKFSMVKYLLNENGHKLDSIVNEIEFENEINQTQVYKLSENHFLILLILKDPINPDINAVKVLIADKQFNITENNDITKLLDPLVDLNFLSLYHNGITKDKFNLYAVRKDSTSVIYTFDIVGKLWEHIELPAAYTALSISLPMIDGVGSVIAISDYSEIEPSSLKIYQSDGAGNLTLKEDLLTDNPDDRFNIKAMFWTPDKNLLLHINQIHVSQIPLFVRQDYHCNALLDTRKVGIISKVIGQETTFKNKLIPNPSNDLVSFHLDNATRQHVNQYLIRDLQGKMVKDKSPINESSESTISTLDLPSGMYIIQFLKDGKLIDAQKLVISH